MVKNRFQWSKYNAAWEREKKRLPVVVANKAENHFKNNFSLGGFMDEKLEKWAPRKAADAGRALLVKTGRLMRSIRATVSNMVIRISTDVPYAKYINEGTGKMPQRQFLGNSKKLNDEIQNEIDKSLKNVFK